MQAVMFPAFGGAADIPHRRVEEGLATPAFQIAAGRDAERLAPITTPL